MIKDNNLKPILIKSVANIYQSFKEYMKNELRKIKVMNSMQKDYKLKNSLKNY